MVHELLSPLQFTVVLKESPRMNSDFRIFESEAVGGSFGFGVHTFQGFRVSGLGLQCLQGLAFRVYLRL